jgi:hypothetical protein
MSEDDIKQLTENYEEAKKLYLEIKPGEETTDEPDDGGEPQAVAEAEPATTEVFKQARSIDKKKILTGITKIVKTATGIQGFQDRKSAKQIKSISEAVYKAASELTDARRVALNDTIVSFGKFRLESLHETIGRFLGFLKDMGQNNKTKEYEILDEIGLDTEKIDEMKSIDMNASKALTSTAITGALGAAAAMGTPTLVTGAVGLLAHASTGTAIVGLSGAAKTSAILAWLGGGPIGVGGGMAAGSAVLAGITATATAGVAILAAGLMASTHYARKLTEAKEYQKEVEIAINEMEKAWVLMDGIAKRTDEMYSVTQELEKRIKEQLEYLEPLTIDFDTSSEYYNRTFQKSGLLIKSMGELAQTPLLNEDGNISDETTKIMSKTHSILNKELAYNE